MLHVGLLLALSAVLLLQTSTSAFVPLVRKAGTRSTLFAEDEEKAGPLVSGEELEVLLQGLTQPLVIDAYATWYVPVHSERVAITAFPKD